MIIWLASYPKSGNTWWRLLLNGYYTGVVNINAMTYCRGDNDRYFTQALCPSTTLTQKDAAILRPAALLHAVAAVSQRPLFMKTHHANLSMDGIPSIPEALTKAAIYIVRDPRDVVLSCARHFGLSIDESIDALNDKQRVIGETPEMIHALGDWTLHVQSWTNQKTEYPVLAVRYEDMLNDAEYILTHVLDRLGEEADFARVQMAVKLSGFERVKLQEEHTGFREKPKECDAFFHSGESTWRKILKDHQIKRIEIAHGEEMRRHGYDPVML